MDCNLFNTAMVSYWKCLENWGVHLTQRSFQLSPPFPPPPPFISPNCLSQALRPLEALESG